MAGTSLSTGRYFDGALPLGYLFASHERLRIEFDEIEILTRDHLATARRMAEAELAEYAAWLRGEVYRFSIRDTAGKVIAEEGGFIGIDWALEAARYVLAATAATTDGASLRRSA